MKNAKKYIAFISYRHVNRDRREAKWLHRSLETFAIPHAFRTRAKSARLGKVFRDEEELHATSDLPQTILDALDHSEWLIVICSSKTPDSAWVGAEVQHFIKTGRGDRVLLLLIDGSPETSFPRQLLDGAVSSRTDGMHSLSLPLAADIRPVEDESRSKRRRFGLLRLAAAILGCSFDDLRRREDERRRTRTRLTAAASMVSAALFGWLAILADMNAVDARLQGDAAIRGNAHALINLGVAAFEDRKLVEAELAFAEALTLQDTVETRQKLIEVASRGLEVHWTAPSFSSGHRVVTFPDGERVLALHDDNSLVIWDLPSRQPMRRIRGVGTALTDIAVNGAGDRFVSVDRHGVMRISDIQDGAVLAERNMGTPAFLGVWFDQDGSLLAVRRSNEVLRLSPSELATLETTNVDLAPVTSAAFSRQTRRLFLGTREGEIVAYGTTEMTMVAKASYGDIRIEALEYDPIGNQIAAWGSTAGASALPPETMVIKIFDATSGAETLELSGQFGFPSPQAMSFFDEGRKLAIGQIATDFRIWNLETNKEIISLPFGKVDDIAAVPGGAALFTIGDSSRMVDSRTFVELPVLSGHSSSAQAVAFTSDASQLLSLGLKGELLVWDVSDQAEASGPVFPIERFRLSSEASTLTSVLVDSEDRLALMCTPGLALIWRLSGKLQDRISTASSWSEDQCVALDKTGQGFWSISRENRLQFYDFAAGQLTREEPAPDDSRMVANAHGGLLLVADAAHTLHLLNVETGARTIFAPVFQAGVRSMVMAEEGDRVFAADRTTLQAWATDGPRTPLWTVVLGQELHQIALSRDGHRLAVALHDEIQIRNAFSGILEARFDPNIGFESHVNSVEFSPDGRMLAYGNDAGTVGIWRYGQAAIATAIRSPTRRADNRSPSISAAFSRNSEHITILESDGAIGLWTVPALHQVKRQKLGEDISGGHGIVATESGFVTGSRSGRIVFLSDRLEELDSVQIQPADITVVVLDAENTTNRLAVAYGKSPGAHPWAIGIFDPDAEPNLTTVGQHQRHVLDAVFDRCGGTLLTGAYDRTAVLWGRGDPIPLPGHDGTVTGVALSPGCDLIATGARDGRLRVFDGNSLALLENLQGVDGDDWIESVAFTPDGKRLMSAGNDGALRIWDPTTWTEVIEIRGFHDQWVQAMTVDSNGTLVFTYTQDKSYLVWDLDALDLFLQTSPDELLRQSQEKFDRSATVVEGPFAEKSLFGTWVTDRFGVDLKGMLSEVWWTTD